MNWLSTAIEKSKGRVICNLELNEVAAILNFLKKCAAPAWCEWSNSGCLVKLPLGFFFVYLFPLRQKERIWLPKFGYEKSCLYWPAYPNFLFSFMKKSSDYIVFLFLYFYKQKQDECLLEDLWTLMRAGRLEEACNLCRSAGQVSKAHVNNVMLFVFWVSLLIDTEIW